MTEWLQRIQKYAHTRWYPLVLAFLAALDHFVVIIPTDGLLITSVMLAPKRWITKFLWLTFGSVLGGVLLAVMVQHYGNPFLEWVMPGIHGARSWQITQDFMESYGLWTLFGVAASPFIQHPAIAIAALMELPLLHIAGALIAGRLLKYALFAYLASHAPRYLLKVKFIRKEIEEAQSVQAAKDAAKIAEVAGAASGAPARADQAAR